MNSMELEDIEERSRKLLYQVNVVILEGRHLAMKNASTRVILSIGKRRKKIHAKSNKTDCPHFNEYCTFTYHLPLNVLLDKFLTVRVFQITRYRKKVVGSFKVELATIWNQPNHQFYHKWAVLAENTRTKTANARTLIKGFLKCDLSIIAKGVSLKPPEDFRDDRVDENILVPHGAISDRHRAKLTISVFRADNFSAEKPNRTAPTFKKPFIKISYGGEIKKTRTAKNKRNPVWNEEITFLDLYPPLSTSIFIELCDRSKKSKRERYVGNTNIDIGSLGENGDYGFLPTFGPNFLYLYKPLKKFERHRNCCSLENSFTYVGRLLCAIRMETFEHPEEAKIQKITRKNLPKLIPPINENNYFTYEKFILFASVFGVICFETKRLSGDVKVGLTIGPKCKNRFSLRKTVKKEKKRKRKGMRSAQETPHLEVVTSCSTTKRKRCKNRDDYNYLYYSGKHPCVHIFGEWPNNLRKSYRSNIAKKAFVKCAEELNKLKVELEFEYERSYTLADKLRDVLCELAINCDNIISNTRKITCQDTNLFRQRKAFYHNAIANLSYIAKDASIRSALLVRDTVQKVSVYITTLRKFYQDPENSYPDTEIWFTRNIQEHYQCRIRTDDIAYSSRKIERGMNSGKIQTVFLKGKKNELKAKLDLFMWFGKADDFKECLKMLPSGYKKEYPVCSSNLQMDIPSKLVYDEQHYYEFRVHLFEGKILLGFDDSGRADPFVRIIMCGRNLRTKTRKQTLSPMWDETLFIPSLKIYGPPCFVKENPTSLVVELFDKELIGKKTLLGRTFIKPAVRLITDTYTLPHFPPKLKWEDVMNKSVKIGQILMSAELRELPSKQWPIGNRTTFPVPENVRPHLAKHRVEIVFWGLRELKSLKIKNKVVLVLEFGQHFIKSPVLKNVRQKKNFPFDIKFYDVNLPEEPEYAPPLSIKLYRYYPVIRFKSYVANCFVPSMRYFYCYIGTLTEDEKKRTRHIKIARDEDKKLEQQKKIELKRRETRAEYARRVLGEVYVAIGETMSRMYADFKCNVARKCHNTGYFMEPNTEDCNWWTRYHASVYGPENYPSVMSFKYYREELEAQPEFRGFNDHLTTFNMMVGHELKKRGKILAKFKAHIRVYKLPCGKEKDKMFAQNRIAVTPTNEPIKVVVRVYIVAGKNLSPKDIYGKADPYVHLQLGKVKINDRKHYVKRQVNPTFGRCFEIKTSFPKASLLIIKVIDHDATGKDDLIGETKIDVENRYYSKYHASCGISREYHTVGTSAWRDIYHPTDILKKVCLKSELDPPVYEKDCVMVGKHEFRTPGDPIGKHRTERQALKVLRTWEKVPRHGFQLVPEHVESRALYHPKIPGIEQGKLEMWVDIFPADYRFMPPKIDITPQKPVPVELRAIVWNVDDVALDDKTLLFQDRMTDLYVKGWIVSLEDDAQKTDIYFRSLNGEGSFNWRFIFHFNYIQTERVMVTRKKTNPCDLNPQEKKTQCLLEIQIWDNDAFGNDCLGDLILELSALPTGAKLPSRATLKMLAPNFPKVDLFRIRKTRGWWPFRRLIGKNDFGSEYELAGRVDLELEVLTEKEAKKKPAGLGRSEPDPLPVPKRQSTTFYWMLHPFKTFRLIVLRKFFQCFIFTLVIGGFGVYYATYFYAASLSDYRGL